MKLARWTEQRADGPDRRCLLLHLTHVLHMPIETWGDGVPTFTVQQARTYVYVVWTASPSEDVCAGNPSGYLPSLPRSLYALHDLFLSLPSFLLPFLRPNLGLIDIDKGPLP